MTCGKKPFEVVPECFLDASFPSSSRQSLVRVDNSWNTTRGIGKALTLGQIKERAWFH